jgi:acyl-CoA thioester hydrolase
MTATHPSLNTLEHRITIQPSDILGPHVNLARYFAFINEAFQVWYAAMGVGVPTNYPGFGNMMAHLEYDFLREVDYPGTVMVKLRVGRIGRTSLEHAIEIHDISTGKEARLAGRGKSIHVWVNRALGKSEPYPAEILGKCWSTNAAVAALPTI